LSLAGAIAIAIQRARYGRAMTDHVRDAADNPVSLAILATGDPITFAGMEDAEHNNSVMTIQDRTATGGLVMQANEMSFVH
jgi:Ni,Fe-hydrogenase I small subunit